MTLTRAITDARDRMRHMAPALAIYKTASEYGCTTRDLAVAVRGQRLRRHSALRSDSTSNLNAWWNK